MTTESGERSASRGEILIREAFETAKGFDWDLEADDILARVRRPDRRGRRRVEVVLVTALILVVFFAPLPGINLFHRLQGHNGISPTGPSTVPTTPRQTTTPVLSSGTLAYLSPVGEQTAWAVVDTSDGGEHVLRTVDGGTSWADVTPSQLTALVTPTNVGNGASTPQVIFFGAERAWTAAAGKLVATDDGGASWRDVAALPPSCVPVQFVDPSHGWCNASFVGQGMSSTVDLYRTVDGGRRWQHVQSVDLPNSASKGELPYECQKGFRFTTPSVGWVGLSCGGYVDQVYETTNAGADWIARTISTPSSLAKAEILMMPPIFVGNLGAGVMSVNAGDTVMYYSDDGGRSWHTVVPPGGLQPWGIDVISPLQWRLANAQSILSTTDGGRTWQTLAPRWPFPLGNPEKYGVPIIQFVTASIGWGQFWDSKTGTNTLWRTTDGGLQWTKVLYSRSDSKITLGQLAGTFYGGKGFGQVEPSEFYNGGDASGAVRHIVWQSWGGLKAVGTGEGEYVGPGQDVAEATAESATVVAFDRGDCYGNLMYQAIEWYFPRHGQSFDPNQYENICTGAFVTSAKTASTCPPSHIAVGTGPEISPATGEQALVVTLSNEGPRPCVLDGYPRLRLVTSADTVLNLPQVTHSQYLLATVARPVMLAVGAFAYVAIAKYRCDLGDLQVPSRLRLTLPGASAGTALTLSGRVISGLDLCKGGRSDPGNLIAVTPVESTLADSLP
jgi:photosystem II stability/assembly factor-like uncharacterized protein